MKKNNKGQSLFEVLFSVALAAIIVTGVASVALTSVRNAEFARNQSEARQIAQNMLEDARIYRDNNPDDLFVDGKIPPVNSCNTGYNCSYDVTPPGAADTKTIVANVSWTDGRGTHTISAQTRLTAWEI